MNFEIENFVGIFRDAYSKEFCQDAIDLFEEAARQGFTGSRKKYEGANSTIKDDEALFTSDMIHETLDGNIIDPGNQAFFKVFWEDIYPKYVEKYGVVEKHERHHIFYNKMQKTNPGEGYHVWHCENSSRQHSNRILTYILYLNDVEEGGETELLYYSKRFKPERGTLLLFPGGFTHTHRGNPPLSGSKYIMTGWVEM